jgi:hypothetical protein
MVTVGGGALLTSTLKVELTVPPGPVAVAMYAVVLFGETMTDPFAGCTPRLLSMLTLSAFEEVQLRLVLPPWMMLAGAALKVSVGGNTTSTLAFAVTDPANPVAVAV